MIPYEGTSRAERQWRKLPTPIQHEVLTKLEYFLQAPEPLQFAEPLVGHRGKRYRFRIRGYRLIFELSEGKLLILAVDRRDKIYS